MNNIDGLIYLLNQAGAALVEANAKIEALSAYAQELQKQINEIEEEKSKS